MALSCAEPPQGRAQGSLRWLADRVGELGASARVAHETVRRILRKRPPAGAVPRLGDPPAGPRGLRGGAGAKTKVTARRIKTDWARFLRETAEVAAWQAARDRLRN